MIGKNEQRQKASRGFTLLELMIVISIIIVLAVVAIPRYEKAVQAARESTLHYNLGELRKSLDQYAADKGHLPQTLDDLVTAGYIREVPVDPITEQHDWVSSNGPDVNSTRGGQGITDVHSASNDTDSAGKSYSEY